MSSNHLAGGHDIFSCGIQRVVADIFQYRLGKEERLLQHHAHHIADRLLHHVPYVVAINGDRTLLDIVKTVSQCGNRRLSRPCGANKSNGLTWIGSESDISKNRPIRVIPKCYVIEFHTPFHCTNWLGAGLVLYFKWNIE